jgi:hypothetical protein
VIQRVRNTGRKASKILLRVSDNQPINEEAVHKQKLRLIRAITELDKLLCHSVSLNPTPFPEKGVESNLKVIVALGKPLHR